MVFPRVMVRRRWEMNRKDYTGHTEAGHCRSTAIAGSDQRQQTPFLKVFFTFPLHFFPWSHLPAPCIQAMFLIPLPGVAYCSSNISQLFPPNIPHKHPFPLQKALGKHMRESRETNSKQKTGHRNLNLRSLTLCH